MINPKVTIDTRGFNAALKQYMEFNKKAIPEIINTKAYFVARGAVALTTATDPNKIANELLSNGKGGNAPLAALIVNSQQKAKGLKGLNGPKMQAAIDKLIKARKRTVNFLRSGWIPAIKYFESKIPSKTGAPKYKKVKTFGSPKGGARAAKPSNNWSCSSEIWNDVTGGKKDIGLNQSSSPSKVSQVIMDGLQKAINKEQASMIAYVEKKLNQGINKFNRS